MFMITRSNRLKGKGITNCNSLVQQLDYHNGPLLTLRFEIVWVMGTYALSI